MSRIRGMPEISRVHGGSSELSPEGERRVINAIAHDVEAQIREGDTYYLISMRWWRNWSMFVNLDGPMNTDNGSLIVNQGSLRRPPRINNFDLVCGALSINPVVEIYDSLVEGTHYILVPEQIWNHLHSWYGGGPPIARKVIARGPSSTEFSVEVYPLRLLLHKVPRPDQCVVKLSRKETIGDLYRKACEIFHLNMNQVLIWDYYGRRKHLLLIDFGETLDTANIQMDQDILVEVLNQIGSYRDIGFRDNGSAPNNRLSAADSSRANHSITRGSSSNGVSRNYSPVLTNFQKLSLASKEPIRAPPCIGVSTSGSCGGLVGLLNFDNSCFMNSAIQCLVHTPEFARYFLGDFHMEINWHNPMGTAGELAMEFAELLRRLWGPGSASFDPHAFKAKLARFAPQFAGNDQHDSQELLAFLLDGLHEDLNRVKQKLYIKSRDADGRPDEEVADEYWANHKARNDSIILDVCQGQYKSTLICPVCDKTSVTFDPFMQLSLPLRFMRPRKMRITFFSCDGSFMPSTFTVTVPKVGCLQDLIRALANSCCSVQQNEKILLAKIQDHLIHKFFEDPLMPLSVIKDGDCIAAYKIPKLTNNTRYLQLIHRCKDPETSNIKGIRMWKPIGTPLIFPVYNDASITRGDIRSMVNTMLSPLLKLENFETKTSLIVSDPSSSNTHSEAPLLKLPIKLVDENNTLVDLSVGEHEAVTFPSSSVLVQVYIDWSPQLVKNYEMHFFENLPQVFKHVPGTKKTRGGPMSLYTCLEAFLREESLVPDDMWFCPECKEQRQASKKLDLWRLPQVLIIHLKRFSYSRTTRDKIKTFVNFPFHHFDLTKYVANKNNPRRHVYELYAVANHYGNMGSVHYTANVKVSSHNL